MLPKKHLISLKNGAGQNSRNGKVYDSPSFRVNVSFSPDSVGPQCAFVVSKKVDLHSVTRHKIKRILADTIGQYLPKLGKNLILVFVAKPASTKSTQESISLEMENILSRANLLK